ILALVPIASACSLRWTVRPNRILACSISDPVYDTCAVDDSTDAPLLQPEYESLVPREIPSRKVVVSTEPTIAIPESVVESPVNFPGYVLPDDPREGLLHEGS